jgi:hypothetical protein
MKKKKILTFRTDISKDQWYRFGQVILASQVVV